MRQQTLTKDPGIPEVLVSMAPWHSPLPSGRSLRRWTVTVDQGRTRVRYQLALDEDRATELYRERVSDYRRAGYR